MKAPLAGWLSRLRALVRGMLDESARTTTTALLVVAALSAVALTTSTLVLHSAQPGTEQRRPVPRGVVAVAPLPAVVLPIDGHDAGAGSDRLLLTGTPRLSERVLRLLADVPGARKAVLDQSLAVVVAPVPPLATMRGAATRTAGVRTTLSTWAAADLAGTGLVRGKPPTGADTAVVGRAAAAEVGVGVGQEIEVSTTAGTPTRLRVTGIGDDAGAVGPEQVLVGASGMASVAGQDLPVATDRAWVRVPADGGRSLHRIAAAVARTAGTVPVPTVVVGPGGLLPAGPDPTGESLVGLAVIVSTVIAVVSGFVLCGTSSFAIARRSRLLALARLTGATPAQVRGDLLREASVLGVFAVVVGVGAGYLLSGPVVAGLVLVGLAGPGTHLRLALWPAVVGGLAGWAVPVLAVLVTARRVTALLPAQALREALAPTRRPGSLRRAAGAVLMGGAGVLVLVVGQAPVAQAANIALTLAFCLTAAVALLGPDLVRLAGPLLALALTRLGGSGYVAARSLRRQPFRSAALSQPLVLAVALAGVLLCTGSMIDASAVQQVRAHSAPAFVVSTAGVPAPVADAVRKVQGVRAAVRVQESRVIVRRPAPRGLRELAAAALDGPPGTAVRLTPIKGAPGDLGPGWSLLSQAAARDLSLTVGDDITTYGPDGHASTTRVAAVISGSDGFADVVLDASDLPGAAGTIHGPPAYLAVDAPTQVVDDVLPGAVAAASAQLVGRRLTVQDRAQWVMGTRVRAVQDVRGIYVLVASILLLSAASLIVTGSIDIASRHHELAQLRVSGATGVQLRRSLSIEGAAAAAMGGAVGVVVVLISSALLARTLPGHPAPDLRGALWLSTGCVVAGTAVFAVLARSSLTGDAAAPATRS